MSAAIDRYDGPDVIFHLRKVGAAVDLYTAPAVIHALRSRGIRVAVRMTTSPISTWVVAPGDDERLTPAVCSAIRTHAEEEPVLWTEPAGRGPCRVFVPSTLVEEAS